MRQARIDHTKSPGQPRTSQWQNRVNQPTSLVGSCRRTAGINDLAVWPQLAELRPTARATGRVVRGLFRRVFAQEQQAPPKQEPALELDLLPFVAQAGRSLPDDLSSLH